MVGRTWILVVAMALGAGLAACGSAGADGELMCSGVMPQNACNDDASVAVEACHQGAPASDPSCTSKACMLKRSACVTAALEEAKRCGACWGCDAMVEARSCELGCETQIAACIESAPDDDARAACWSDACYTAACHVTGPLEPSAC